MKLNFSKHKYQLIKNVLSKGMSEFITDYYFLKQQTAARFKADGYITMDRDEWGFWNDTQIPGSYCCYADLISEMLLIKIQPLVEKISKQKLLPTYSFMRIYKKGDELKIHKDRPSCEVSCTLNLGGDKWPIFFKENNKKETKLILNSGDLAVYRGCELHHWREPFTGDYCVQVFLHYANEKNKELLFDTRPAIALPGTYKKNLPFYNRLLQEGFLKDKK